MKSKLLQLKSTLVATFALSAVSQSVIVVYLAITLATNVKVCFYRNLFVVKTIKNLCKIQRIKRKGGYCLISLEQKILNRT